ncbi:MAG: pyridoxal-phosphate dependent enzyme [Halioglobus sp.]
MWDCPSRASSASSLLHTLGHSPVLGVSLGNVSVLRLDQTGGPAPGNKSFKLNNYVLQAERTGISRLVSFGGVWSNHLHALAAVGHNCGIETVGIVRGAASECETPMLIDAQRCGMQIVPVSRQEYRRRQDADYQRDIAEYFAPCLLVPEGGASVVGAQGCAPIAEMILSLAPQVRHVVVPVGTGTTLAGLAAQLDDSYQLHGISALKGAIDMHQRVQNLLRELSPVCGARWRILHDFHCGGFARVNTQLREFILAFEHVHRIQLEPVYTGKTLLAIHQLRQRGEWSEDEAVLVIHTGGLQGRRGYAWLP